LELGEDASYNKKLDDLDEDYDLVFTLDLLKPGGVHGDILGNTLRFANAKP
jgi:hypothetical protein